MGGPAGYMLAQPAIWWANPLQTLPQGLVLTLTLTLTLSLTKKVAWWVVVVVGQPVTTPTSGSSFDF